MKQRLRLAFAVLAAPQVLLLDEAESNLDADGREVLRGVIREHARTGFVLFFFQAEDGIRVLIVPGVQTCALPILPPASRPSAPASLNAVSANTPISRAPS